MVAAVIAAAAAANACTVVAALSGHRAAADNNVVRSLTVAAANAGSPSPAFGRQAAAASFFIVLQGQRSFGGVFFKTCLEIAAFQLVIAVQLDGHIAVSLNTQGGFTVGVAHIDLHVLQGEVQHRIGKDVDHRNGVLPIFHWGRGYRGGLLGLGLLICVLLLVSILLLVGILLLISAFRLVSALRLVGILLLVGAFLLVSILRLVSVLLLVGTLRLVSILRLGRGSGLVVVLYHRAKVGILCCGAFQVALLRGGGLVTGGDDDLTTIVIGSGTSVLFAILDGLAAIRIFGDGNIAVVDVVGPCKGRSRQRHCDAQRRHQSCCPAECVGLPHGRGLLSFSTFSFSCAFCTSLLRVFLIFIVPPPPIFAIGKNNKIFT